MSHVAIFTKYFGPSNSNGSRIKATWGDDSIYIPYPADIGKEENRHRAAAEALRQKLAKKHKKPDELIFTLPLEHAGNPAGGYVFVLNPAARHLARVLVSRCEIGQHGNPYCYKSIRDALAFFSDRGEWQDNSYKLFTGYPLDENGHTCAGAAK